MVVERQVQSISVTGENEVVRMELEAGSFFGEAELMPHNGRYLRRHASVKALEMCHLYLLSFEDFHQAIGDFPEYRSVLRVSTTS